MTAKINTFKTSLSDLTDKNVREIYSLCRQKGLKVHQQKNWLVMEGTSAESATAAKYIQSQAGKMRAANRKIANAKQAKSPATQSSTTRTASPKPKTATAPKPKTPTPTVPISRTPPLKSFLTPAANAEQRMAQYLNYIRTLSASPTTTNATLANVLNVAYATQYQIAIAAKGEQAVAEATVLKALETARNNVHTTTAPLEATVTRNLQRMQQAQKALNTTKSAVNETAYLAARQHYTNAIKTLESARFEASINALNKATHQLSSISQVKQILPMAAEFSGNALPAAEATAGVAQATAASKTTPANKIVTPGISQSDDIIVDFSKVKTAEIQSTLKKLHKAKIMPKDIDLYGTGLKDAFPIDLKALKILQKNPKLMSELTKAGVQISLPQAGTASAGIGSTIAEAKTGAAIGKSASTLGKIARGTVYTTAAMAAVDPDGTSETIDDVVHLRVGKIWNDVKNAGIAIGELGVKAVKNPKKALETMGNIAQDAYQSSANYVTENSLGEIAKDVGKGVEQGVLNIGETVLNTAGSVADVTVQPLYSKVGEWINPGYEYEHKQIKYKEISKDPFGFITNSIVSTDTKTGLRSNDTLFSIIDDNRIAAATALLKQEIDINMREPSSNGTGETPLMYAISKNRPRIAFQILQDKRTDINARLPNGRSALVQALNNSAPEDEDVYNGYSDTSDLPIEAQTVAYNNALLISKMITDKRLDLNQTDVEGKNLFMHAAESSNLNALELLRERGVSTNHIDKQGQNALHVSVKDPVITRILLDMGVSHSQRDKSGKTPLMVALNINRQTKNKNDRVVSILVNASDQAELEYVRQHPQYTTLLNEWLAQHKDTNPNLPDETNSNDKTNLADKTNQEQAQILDDRTNQGSQPINKNTESELPQTSEQTTAETTTQPTTQDDSSLPQKPTQTETSASDSVSNAQNNKSPEETSQSDDQANTAIWKKVKLPNYDWDLAPFSPGQWVYARAEKAIYDADNLVRQAGLDVPEQGSLGYAIETGSFDSQKMTGEDIYQLALSQYQKAKQAYLTAGKEMPAYNYPEIIETAKQIEQKAETPTQAETPAPSTPSNSPEEGQQKPAEKMVALPNETPEETKARYDMYRKSAYNRSVYNKIIQAYQENAAMDEKINSSYNIKEELAKKEAHLNQISEELKQAISAGYDVNFATTEQGFAPLAHFVTTHNDLSSLKLLQEAGADLNLTDNNGQTTAHKAIGKDMINYLAQHNVDLNKKDNNGMTPLIHITSTHNRPYDYKTGKYIDTVEPLIRAGVNTDIQDNTGKTAFDYANAMDMRIIRETEQQIREEYQRKATNNEFDEATKQIIEHVKQQKTEQAKLKERAIQLAKEEAVKREQLAQQKAEAETVQSTQTESTSTETTPVVQNIQKMTIRHQYGETEEQHTKVLTHAITRNKRIKTKQRTKALDNIHRMEELGLVAKGPNGESNADVYLYKIYQSTKLLAANSELHLDLDEDGKAEKIPTSELLSSADGKTHKQIYKALTTKNLSDAELYKFVDMVNNAETLINERGEVISDIPQSVGRNKHRMIAKAQVYELEEPLREDELAFHPDEDTTIEESDKVNKSGLKNRLGDAQKDSDDTPSDLTVAQNHLSDKLGNAQINQNIYSEYSIDTNLQKQNFLSKIV